MQATKQKELYFLFRDKSGEYFIVLDENKTHAIETAKDWFSGEIFFQREVSENYAEQSGLDIY